MKLAMEVAVIPNLVALGFDAMHQLRPLLRMPSENEERRLHSELAEDVEHEPNDDETTVRLTSGVVPIRGTDP